LRMAVSTGIFNVRVKRKSEKNKRNKKKKVRAKFKEGRKKGGKEMAARISLERERSPARSEKKDGGSQNRR